MIKEYALIFFNLFILFVVHIIIFSDLNLFGIINPSVFLLFILLYKFDSEQVNFIIFSFLYGILFDLILQTAGNHSISLIFISFLRPTIIRFSLGDNFENNSILGNVRLYNKVVFVSLVTLIHQIIFYSFEFFDFLLFFEIIKLTILNSIFTIIMLLGFLNFFRDKS
tara:strand:+ start:1672 stop:2172 length:501 start_codon:yes stop_codon:yes gene_type:complete